MTRNAARASLLFGVSIGAMLATSPALAQDNPPPDTDAEVAAPEQSVAPPVTQPTPADESEIVVTGSRIRRTEATSASPLQIIDPTLALRQGQVSTAEVIQSSPIASGSSQITSAISTNFVTNGGPGSQTVSLRGLGAERTLVLLNSKRAGPAGTRGGVTAFDLNVLPSSIIRSVEILKDGASSVYGSDAIAGVVNILTKTETDGIQITGSSTTPFKSGGEQYDVSVTYGKDFGRGHFLVSANYYKQRALLRKDRKFLDCPEDYIFRPDGSGTRPGKERADLIDPRTNAPNCINGVTWGHVWTYYAYNVPDFGDGVLLQPDFGQNLGQYPGVFPVPAPSGPGDLLVPPGYWPVSLEDNGPSTAVGNFYHPFERNTTVIPQTTRKTLYADASFDVTDNIELYGEFLFNNRKTHTESVVQIYNFGGVNSEPTPGEPFPGFYQEECGLYYCVYLSPTNIVDRYDNTIEVDYYRTVAGLRGEIANNWRWDLYGQYSISKGKYTYDQIVEDALYTQWYKYGTCEGDVTPISNRQCIDINWVDPEFLRGNLTEEQFGFLMGEETGHTKYTQKYIEGSVTGNLFRLPAGPVGIAVGAVHRRDQINDRPGDITMAPNPFFDPSLDPDDPLCTTEPGEICSEFVDNAYANPVSSGHTRGYQTTNEIFGEINVPILRNSPIGNFEFSGAARITNVKAVRQPDGLTDSNKGNWTYKLMGNWQVTPWVRLRATYGTSFRAPALFEQFLAGQVTGARQVNVDPCVEWQEALNDQLITQRMADNCAADQTFSGGPADGIDPDHDGGGIQVKIFNSGGIGQLEPETSKALTLSAILTPKFGFLPDTDLALTIDYFRITVEGEITQLGARNVLEGCYDAEDFPNNPLCSLFRRGQIGDPELIIDVQDSFINVNRQRNHGLDFTFRANHRFGRDTRLTILANTTYQLKDDITLFGGDIDDLNGEVGDPKFIGDLNFNLDAGPWSFFWGIDYVGKTSNNKQFIEDNGRICFDPANPDHGASGVYNNLPYCYVVSTKAKMYHALSVTRRIADDRFEMTLGINNIFNTKPPRISTGIGGALSTIGQSPAVSQYDWLGRRLFLAVKARLK
jgi:iron complex outermembrane receptor protein